MLWRNWRKTGATVVCMPIDRMRLVIMSVVSGGSVRIFMWRRLQPSILPGVLTRGTRKRSTTIMILSHAWREKYAAIIHRSVRGTNRGGSRNLFWGGPNQGPKSKVEGEARIEGAKRPSIEGEARVEGAKRPRTEGEARKKSGGGVWGGGSVSPSPENFWKIKLETIHFGIYMKQLFEMTNEIV